MSERESSNLSKSSSEIDYKTSRFQPKVILNRLKKEEIHKYMNPDTNIEEKKALIHDNCLDETISIDGSSEGNILVIDLDSDSSVSAEKARPSNIMSSNTIQAVCKSEQLRTTEEYLTDPKWQPKVRLTRLTHRDPKNFEQSHPRTFPTSESSWLQVDPIQFDKDEPLIREFSPRTATQQFQKLMNSIINSNHSLSTQTSNKDKIPFKRSYLEEYEELNKEIQTKRRARKQTTGFRTLFSRHEQNENMDCNRTKDKKERDSIGVQSVSGILTRSHKQNQSSLNNLN